MKVLVSFLIFFSSAFSQKIASIQAQYSQSYTPKRLIRERLKDSKEFAASRKVSSSSCSLRGAEREDQCCNGVDIECFGCNPILLGFGIVSSRIPLPCNNRSSHVSSKQHQLGTK